MPGHGWKSLLDKTKESGIKIILRGGVEIDDLKLKGVLGAAEGAPAWIAEFHSHDGVLHVNLDEIAAILIKKPRSY